MDLNLTWGRRLVSDYYHCDAWRMCVTVCGDENVCIVEYLCEWKWCASVCYCAQSWPWMSTGTHLSTSSAGLFPSSVPLFQHFTSPFSTSAKTHESLSPLKEKVRVISSLILRQSTLARLPPLLCCHYPLLPVVAHIFWSLSCLVCLFFLTM